MNEAEDRETEIQKKKAVNQDEKMVMVIVALAAIAGVTITTVCLPDERFG